MANFSWSGVSEGIKYTNNYYKYDPEVQEYDDVLRQIENGNFSLLSESLERDGRMSILVDSYQLDYRYGDFRLSGTNFSFGDSAVKVSRYGKGYLDGTTYGFGSTTDSGDVIGYITKIESTDLEKGGKSTLIGNFDYSKIEDSSYENYRYYVSGDDTFQLTKYNDELDAGIGNDIVYGNSGDDTFYLAGDPGNDMTLQGDSGADEFEFDYAFTSNINAEGGADNDKFSINTSSNTGLLQIDGGAGTDTLYGSNNSDHYGWNSVNYSSSSISTNSATLSEKGLSTNVSNATNAFFNNIEAIDGNSGSDTFYFGGDPYTDLTLNGNLGNDEFNFDYTLTKNITGLGGDGNDIFTLSKSPGATAVLTLQGNNGADQFNYNTNISGTIVNFGGNGEDTFQFNNTDILGNLSIYTGNGNDDLEFNSKNSGSNLEITDFLTGNDNFEFSSAAFNGNDGHVLVFGTVNTLDTNINVFVASEDNGITQAFDNTDTSVTAQGIDLLNRNDDVWLYDTGTGYLYYDEDADQVMDDAVTIAKVKSDGITLDTNSFKSSDIIYNNDDGSLA